MIQDREPDKPLKLPEGESDADQNDSVLAGGAAVSDCPPATRTSGSS